MILADIFDLEAILGRSLAGQAEQVDRLLMLASGLVNETMRYRSAPSPVPVLVRTTVANAVVRVLVNPTGVESQTAGPFSATYSAAEPGLYLLDTEVRNLETLRGRSALFTIQTTRGGDWVETNWVHTNIGGEQVPFETIAEPT